MFTFESVMPRNSIHITAPALPKRLFWDINFEELDWDKAFLFVIERVIEKGSAEDMEEMTRYYGRDKIIDLLKNTITYLATYAEIKVCNYYHLQREDLLCYHLKKNKPNNWI